MNDRLLSLVLDLLGKCNSITITMDNFIKLYLVKSI